MPLSALSAITSTTSNTSGEGALGFDVGQLTCSADRVPQVTGAGAVGGRGSKLPQAIAFGGVDTLGTTVNVKFDVVVVR